MSVMIYDIIKTHFLPPTYSISNSHDLPSHPINIVHIVIRCTLENLLPMCESGGLYRRGHKASCNGIRLNIRYISVVISVYCIMPLSLFGSPGCTIPD